MMGILPHMNCHSMGASANSSPISISGLWLSNSLVGFRWVPSPMGPIGKNKSRKRIHNTRAAADEVEGEVVANEVKEVEDADFEARLSKFQRKVRSGSGKKAELRKLRKAGTGTDGRAKSSKRTAVLLPPIPLEDPMSDGLKVELGFNPYTERLNGRFAALGLAAVLLVELASGQSFIKYHAPGTLILQTYFVLAVSAIFVKYEKERKSVWPKSKP